MDESEDGREEVVEAGEGWWRQGKGTVHELTITSW